MVRFDTGSRKDRRTFLAVPLTPDAQAAHPEGIRRTYMNSRNMIRFGLRDAHPGQYSITDADTGNEITTAYVRVTSK